MASDIHYLVLFGTFFMLLGIIAPMLNAEFGTTYTAHNYIEAGGDISSLTAWVVIGNMFVIPFWTFGFPAWINIILLFFRMPFWFLLARNVWVGGS